MYLIREAPEEHAFLFQYTIEAAYLRRLTDARVAIIGAQIDPNKLIKLQTPSSASLETLTSILDTIPIIILDTIPIIIQINFQKFPEISEIGIQSEMFGN